jgi:transcription termination factor Rho
MSLNGRIRVIYRVSSYASIFCIANFTSCYQPANHCTPFRAPFHLHLYLMHTLEELTKKPLDELQKVATNLKVEETARFTAQELIYKILDHQSLKPKVKPIAKERTTTKTKANNERKPDTAATPKSSPRAGKENKKTAAVASDKKHIATKKTGQPGEKKVKVPQGPRNAEQAKSSNSKNHSSQSQGPKEKQEKSAEEIAAKDTKDAQEKKWQEAMHELQGLIEAEGVLEMAAEGGYGFLRSSFYNYLPSPDDVYVPNAQIKKWGLKAGDTVKGKLNAPKLGDKYFSLFEISYVNGFKPDNLRRRVSFEHFTPISPNEKLNIVENPSQYSTRTMDMFAPIGKGQRGMIVAPPKAGKTILLKDIANGIVKNHPEVYLIILLINERPEEVTDMIRNVDAEVIASNFDEQPENHVKVAALTLKKAKRMVESGHDVAILLDSMTRLARAHNIVVRSSGKILSGGVDARALDEPKRFFGAARNLENGGSLTIISTALVETGSKMDEVIFEEFKGTGNMELKLDRRLANRGVYPAIDVLASGTRRNDLLQSDAVCRKLTILRHLTDEMKPQEVIEFLLKSMRGTKDNAAFLASMNT